MLASYFLSRTLVATLSKYWLHKQELNNHSDVPKNYFAYIQSNFEHLFQRIRSNYHDLLKMILEQSKIFVIGFLAVLIASLLMLIPWIGTDFFPSVDSGQIKLHLQAATGTRVEETAKFIDEIDAFIRHIIPAHEVDNIVDNIGLPTSGINLSYSNSSPVGPASADIYISLKSSHHPTANYIRTLRKELPLAFPGMTFSFLPADMVGQILNFGLPSPIDLQVVGLNATSNRVYANYLLERVKHVPGIVDAHIHQAFNYPQLNVM